jgi:hypothetical protein
LKYIYRPQGNVWKPDISLSNGFENVEELGFKFIQVYVTWDGYILWKPFQIFDSKCNLNPTYFPLDQHTCHLDFVVWSLDIDDVTLSVGDEGINMNEALESNAERRIIGIIMLMMTNKGSRFILIENRTFVSVVSVSVVDEDETTSHCPLLSKASFILIPSSPTDSVTSSTFLLFKFPLIWESVCDIQLPCGLLSRSF